MSIWRLSEGPKGGITSEIGTAICEKIASLEKAASKKVNDALNFLAERRKEGRSHRGTGPHLLYDIVII